MLPPNVVWLFVVVEAGVTTLVVIWLVVPVVLGCSVVVDGIGVVATVVGTNPEILMVQKMNKIHNRRNK